MTRPRLGAEALRDELNRAALRLSLDSEGAAIDFGLPTPSPPHHGDAPHNWDVQALCPEALHEIALKAVEYVAARWDLEVEEEQDAAR